MGVRGLQTYLEHYCPTACYVANIAELAKKYTNETGKQAEIVVDAQSCYSLWCKGLDWVLGFEIQEYLYRLKAFVEVFKKVGIKVVFFFGGLTVQEKRKTWISRRLKNLRDVYAVFDFLENGTLTRNLPEKYQSLPPNMGLVTTMLLKLVFDCEVYISIDECDEEIIRYVHVNKSFAIFGQDTDFIVSDIQTLVLSSRNFDYRSMTTIVYDRVALAKHLKIQVKQLPLIGILAGNDLINYEALKGFHSSLCDVAFERNLKFDVLMPALGNYVRSLPRHYPVDQILQMICKDMFGDLSELNLVKFCYESYLVGQEKRCEDATTTWLRILRIARYRHRNSLVPSMLLAILENQEFELAVSFEDLRRSSTKTSARSYMPSATVLRPLRQRMYGILLYECDKKPIVVREWCGENVDSYKQPVITEPILPDVHHPGLLTLWSDTNGKRIDSIKWKLFLSSISSSITNSVEWLQLTEDLVIVAASLYYLLEHKFFSIYEMYAVIATVVTFPLFSRERLNELRYGMPHPRATHISVTFIRTFGTVLSLMAACGYPIPLTKELVLMKLEGKLFQLKYKEMKNRKTIEELCENDQSCINTFYEVKHIVCRAPR